MAKTKRKSTKAKAKTVQELDSVYFLKIVLYLVVGAQWVWIVNPAGSTRFPIPIGLIVGILFASHDHFRLDRKIEYAVLLVAMFVGFMLQSGIFITT